VTHAIDLVIFAILTLAGLVMSFIGLVDGYLAALMNSVGIPPNAQIILLIVAAVVLTVAALRALGGIFGALIIVLLVLLLMHQSFPKMEIPQAHLPAGLNIPGQMHPSI
jgi:hypothetical protein